MSKSEKQRRREQVRDTLVERFRVLAKDDDAAGDLWGVNAYQLWVFFFVGYLTVDPSADDAELAAVLRGATDAQHEVSDIMREQRSVHAAADEP